VARDDWLSAADTFGVPIQRLKEQSTCPDRFISLPPMLGFALTLGLMAHRIVVIDALHRKTFGCMRGSITGDHMGLGKTLQILSKWAFTFVFVLEKNVRELQSAEASSG
jgi:hypothetical protein